MNFFVNKHFDFFDISVSIYFLYLSVHRNILFLYREEDVSALELVNSITN